MRVGAPRPARPRTAPGYSAMNSWPPRRNGHPGGWSWFEGNFEGYQNNKLERLGIEATRPHRVTYRKLTRE